MKKSKKCITYSVLILQLFNSILGETMEAQCDVKDNTNSAAITQGITGIIHLSQNDEEETTIEVKLKGFNTNDTEKVHGFHIHQEADEDNDCNKNGGHYNPEDEDHAAPYNTTRHVGDLGNIEEADDGTVSITIKDSYVQLSGTYSVIGRSFVIHEKRDDLGQGGDAESLRTGNAGKRLACCKITQTDVSAAESLITSHGNHYLLVCSFTFLMFHVKFV